jgi:DNA-binding transcriptional LysR family regulator
MTAFVAVVDRRGFAAAARALRISPSTVTRLVAGLEEHLGIRLLTRTTRSVTLTGGGARYLERARRILADLAEAEACAERERSRPTGTLTITAPVLFGRMHVSGAIAAYLARHPGVGADLQLTDRIVNLSEEGVDVAVRIGDLPDSTMVARRVGATRRVLVAAPSYLARRPAPASPDELERHQLIAFTALAPGRDWIFHRGLRVAARPRYTTNSGEAAIDFALQGGGVTLALSYQVAGAIRDRTLVVLLSDFEPPPLPIHLLYPSSRLLSAKVRLFVDAVAKTSRWDFTRF